MGLREVLGKRFGIDWSFKVMTARSYAASRATTRSFTRNPLSKSWLRSGISGGIDEIRRIDTEIFKAGYELIGGGTYVSPETVEARKTRDHSLP